MTLEHNTQHKIMLFYKKYSVFMMLDQRAPRYNQASTNTIAAFGESQPPLARLEPGTLNITRPKLINNN